MTDYADTSTVEAKASGWSDAQLACRLNHHAWPPPRHRMTLVSRVGTILTVRQTCTRGCGVARECDISDQGYQLNGWSMDYRKAVGYLMVDDHNKSLGRIGGHGRAALWRQALVGVNVREVPDE